MKQTASLARQRLIACECFSGSENNSDASFMLRLVLEANVCHSPCEQDASSIETPGARRGNRATSVQAGLLLLHDSSFHGNDIHWFCTGYQCHCASFASSVLCRSTAIFLSQALTSISIFAFLTHLLRERCCGDPAIVPRSH
jgi:hypothetical protein